MWRECEAKPDDLQDECFDSVKEWLAVNLAKCGGDKPQPDLNGCEQRALEEKLDRYNRCQSLSNQDEIDKCTKDVYLWLEEANAKCEKCEGRLEEKSLQKYEKCETKEGDKRELCEDRVESWLDVEVDMCMLPCEDKANGRAEWRIETYCKNEKCIAKQEAWLERALTNCCKSKAKQARRASTKRARASIPESGARETT